MTVYAKRVTKGEAKAHMLAGGAVLVSEYGHELTHPVGPGSTVHRGGIDKWRSLAADVAMWRNRYPYQRFYIVPDEGHQP